MANRIANEFTPDYISIPGDTLIEVLQARGMTQVELASRTGRSAKTINEIVKGKTPITPETAIFFERALGVPASFWNNRQRRYDEFLARREEEEVLTQNMRWASRFPYKAMARHGWVEDVSDKVSRLRNILDYFAVANPGAWENHWNNMRIAYRVSQAYKPDHYALAAWLRKGELIGLEADCQPYDLARFREHLLRIRHLTKEAPSVFQPRLIDLCADCGVAVAFVRELPKTASGATRWLKPEKALLQLSLKYKTDDQLWFTFIHEAAHILFHQKRGIFIEGGERSSREESEANRFASDFLIPPEDYKSLVSTRPFSCASIRAFAERAGIAPGILVGRLQNDGHLSHSQCNALKKRLEWKTEK